MQTERAQRLRNLLYRSEELFPYHSKGGEYVINEDIRKQLADVGLDVSEMISRFMDSEEMFLKYFRKQWIFVIKQA